MSLSTPTLPRMTPWGLKTTPNNRSSTVKAASRKAVNDIGLALKHVVGTTAHSPCAIDSLPDANVLAFTAGAAAVVTTFDDNLKSVQRFFRARPTAIPLNPTPIVYAPSTPTGNDRTRIAGNAQNSPYATPSNGWSDSPGGKPWSARERVKAASCVSLSPDRKFLAVGETGYLPRVLLFSITNETSSDDPLTCLTDHAFGVRAVAFSHDSQYLASLGEANDGFLYIWKINGRNGAATLYSSNKCTTNITSMTWVGKSLVTVGTRHVKIWRIDGQATPTAPLKSLFSSLSSSISSSAPTTPNSGSRILSGRNCLLGSLIDCTFVAVVAIDYNRAIVCSEDGDICLLDDSDGSQSFAKVGEIPFGISAATRVDADHIAFAGRGGKIHSVRIADLTKNANGPCCVIEDEFDTPMYSSTIILGMAPLEKHVALFDQQSGIRLKRPENLSGPTATVDDFQIASHGAPVLGIQQISTDSNSHSAMSDVKSPISTGDSTGDSAFLTWSANGSILFWNSEGICTSTLHVELEQVDDECDGFANELRVVRLSTDSKLLITGDKCGVVSILEPTLGRALYRTRAHAGEITDIAVSASPPTIATSGRDRTVQVFQFLDDQWQLTQTLDEHVGAVTGVLFSTNNKRLISCSADRTIVVREALSKPDETEVAFSILRTITLKSAPVSMTTSPSNTQSLFVSATDRTIQHFSTESGKSKASFKASDPEGGEAVIISSLFYIPSASGSDLIAGLSSTDKSLRLYDMHGNLCGRDWGHTAGVTDLTLITSKDESARNLVTVAADGTIFIWHLGAKLLGKQDLSLSVDLSALGGTAGQKDLLISKPPLRRVLSQSEVARYRQSSPEHEGTPTTGKATRHGTTSKRSSRFSLAQPPRLEPSSPVKKASTFDFNRRQSSIRRSPSPPSPRNLQRVQKTVSRRASLEPRLTLTRSKSSQNTTTTTPSPPKSAESLSTATDQICRSLRTYRRKLTASTEPLPNDALREVEKELSLMARAIGEKALKNKGKAEEQAMVQLLSQYSERLMEMLDEKFAAASLGASESKRPSTTSDEADSPVKASASEDAVVGTEQGKGQPKSA